MATTYSWNNAVVEYIDWTWPYSMVIIYRVEQSWAELGKSYPATAWTMVFTDGSAENATRNGGCGIYIRQPNKPSITKAIETVTPLEKIPKKVVLFADSLSVLQSLASGNPEDNIFRKLVWDQEQQTYFNEYLHIPTYMETRWPFSWQKLPRNKIAHQKQETS